MLSLMVRIEEVRSQLIRLSKLHGLSHPQTIQCSQQLDELINLSMKEKRELATTK